MLRYQIGIIKIVDLHCLTYVSKGLCSFSAGNFGLGGAIVVICFGSALYMTADLGVSAYDAVAIILAYKWKIGKFQYCRIGADLVCVIAGCAIFLLAGGSWSAVPTIAGVGTIITAFFMGPLIELFNVHVARPLLRRS